MRPFVAAIVAMAALAASQVAGVAQAAGPATPAAGPMAQVQAARAATDKYHKLSTAKAAGFTKLVDKDGIACIAEPGMGAMGVHYVKATLVGDPAIRLRHPEALVYRPTSNGLRLVALEYVVLRKDWRSAHGMNAPRPNLYGHSFNFTPKGNRYGLPAFYSLHAWIWYANPSGMFTMWNPRVHCP
ncbi:MAG TPA: hypothetical protein VFT75_02865 [Nocardioidaceae bacterium]|jgi:hypothetical protein|nr:hypothetical protein [Nocardioidaceae bacterium]